MTPLSLRQIIIISYLPTDYCKKITSASNFGFAFQNVTKQGLQDLEQTTQDLLRSLQKLSSKINELNEGTGDLLKPKLVEDATSAPPQTKRPRCTTCRRRFSDQSLLLLHQKRVHNQGVKFSFWRL